MSQEMRQLIFLIGFIVTFAIRFYFARLAKQNQQVIDGRVTVVERVRLILTILGMLVLPLVYVFTPCFEFADYNLPDGAGWLGAILFGSAIALFWRSHTDLGQNWSASLEVRHDHALVENGVYRYIRHPMYAAFWLWGIAQALLLHNWICGLSYLVSFLPMYLYRVPREEQMMLDRFGEQYQHYSTRTGRVIPKLYSQFDYH